MTTTTKTTRTNPETMRTTETRTGDTEKPKTATKTTPTIVETETAMKATTTTNVTPEAETATKTTPKTSVTLKNQTTTNTKETLNRTEETTAPAPRLLSKETNFASVPSLCPNATKDSALRTPLRNRWTSYV
uniref:Uncharacterized protein n=1 Tax=Cacopsylla melanoneura TaxID=428564 RepID=A0A8D8QHB5_9HEMI